VTPPRENSAGPWRFGCCSRDGSPHPGHLGAAHRRPGGGGEADRDWRRDSAAGWPGGRQIVGETEALPCCVDSSGCAAAASPGRGPRAGGNQTEANKSLATGKLPIWRSLQRRAGLNCSRSGWAARVAARGCCSRGSAEEGPYWSTPTTAFFRGRAGNSPLIREVSPRGSRALAWPQQAAPRPKPRRRASAC